MDWEPCRIKPFSKQELMAEFEWNAKCEEMTNRYLLSNFLDCIKQIINPIEKKVHIDKSIKSLEGFIVALKLQQSLGICPTLYLPDKKIELFSCYNDYPHYEMLIALLKTSLNSNRKQKTNKQIALAELLCSPADIKDEVDSARKANNLTSIENYRTEQGKARNGRFKNISYSSGKEFKECLKDYSNAYDVLTEDFKLTGQQLGIALEMWKSKIMKILNDPTNEKHLVEFQELVNEINTKLHSIKNI